MKLTLIKPYDKQELLIQWLEVNTDVGNFVLQKGHAPMILVLKENQPITYALANGNQTSEKIAGGILKIDRQRVIILLNK